jgi:hypothetical protein
MVLYASHESAAATANEFSFVLIDAVAVIDQQ